MNFRELRANVAKVLELHKATGRLWTPGKWGGSVVVPDHKIDREEFSYGGKLVFESASPTTIGFAVAMHYALPDMAKAADAFAELAEAAGNGKNSDEFIGIAFRNKMKELCND